MHSTQTIKKNGGIVTRGNYVIDLTNTSYLNAIAKQKKLHIEKITDAAGNSLSIQENERTFQYLPKIIQTLSTYEPINQISIDYSAINSDSAFELFPPLIKAKTLAQWGADANLPETPASNYCSFLVNGIVNGRRYLLKKASDCSAGIELTNDEAVALARYYGRSGAIKLEELNTIVFEYKSFFFYLTYGKPCQIGCMDFILFDINDGFMSNYMGVGLRTSDTSLESRRLHVSNIISEMQKYFTVWKETNYETALFPESIRLGFAPIAPLVTITPKNKSTKYNSILSVIDEVFGQSDDSAIETTFKTEKGPSQKFFDRNTGDSKIKSLETITIQFELEGKGSPNLLDQLRGEENIVEVIMLDGLSGYYRVDTSLTSEEIPDFIEKLKRNYLLKEVFHNRSGEEQSFAI